MILFTADWHIKLGQKNVPMAWACSRYKLFFDKIYELEKNVSLHIIGGDLFDRVPSMDEVLARPTPDAQKELLDRIRAGSSNSDADESINDEFDI